MEESEEQTDLNVLMKEWTMNETVMSGALCFVFLYLMVIIIFFWTPKAKLFETRTYVNSLPYQRNRDDTREFVSDTFPNGIKYVIVNNQDKSSSSAAITINLEVGH